MTTITPTQFIQIAAKVGFNEIDACTLLQIAEKESALQCDVIDGYGNYGLLQVNWRYARRGLKEAGIITGADDLLDAETNLRAVHWLRDNYRIDWPPRVGYTNELGDLE